MTEKGLEEAAARVAELGAGLAATQGAEQARLMATYNQALTHLEQLHEAKIPLHEAEGVLDGLGMGDVPLNAPVAILSGGQKTRLGLARVLLGKPHLLLLDEPTNHLDLQSKEVLLDALHHYRGTLVFVSHDRYFVDDLATRVVEVGQGKLLSHPGNYEDFLRFKEGQGDNSHSRERVEHIEGRKASTASSPADSEERTLSHAERKEAKRLERRRQKDLEEIQEKIEKHESELANLEEQMARPEVFNDPQAAREAADRHEELRRELDELYERWAELDVEAAG